MDAHARLDVFSELADWYEHQGQPSMRDRFLVLAADAALAAGLPDQAERLRQRLLQANPHHLLKPYGSFAEALEAADVQTYVSDLRQNYPLETAESLLQTLRDKEQPAPEAPPEAEATLTPGRLGAHPEVFAVRHEEAPASPSPAPPRPAARRDAPAKNRPPRAIPLPRPEGPPPRPTPAPTPPVPLATEPVAPAAPPQTAAEGGGGGAWLASALFGLFLTAGVVLAVYTLARPFLPAGWLP
jgi:hypothetical protein